MRNVGPMPLEGENFLQGAHTTQVTYQNSGQKAVNSPCFGPTTHSHQGCGVHSCPMASSLLLLIYHIGFLNIVYRLCRRSPNTRSPFQDVVINLRPSFKDEMVAQARFLVEYVRLDRIACVFANDQMGVEHAGAAFLKLKLFCGSQFFFDFHIWKFSVPLHICWFCWEMISTLKFAFWVRFPLTQSFLQQQSFNNFFSAQVAKF